MLARSHTARRMEFEPWRRWTRTRKPTARSA
uniref:Uncharacterized protein n=1 Tax=Anopheles albimanus TaxID=7167 RepID=A0A182FI86_ANOAL